MRNLWRGVIFPSGAAKAAVEDSSKRKRHPDILNRTSNGWTTKSTADEIRSQAVQVQLRESKVRKKKLINLLQFFILN